MSLHKKKRKRKRNKWNFTGNFLTFLIIVCMFLSVSIYFKLYGMPDFTFDYNDFLTATKHYILKPKVSTK